MPSNKIYCGVGREWLKSVYDINEPGFIIKTRNHHTNKSNPDKLCEDITFNKKISDSIMNHLEKVTTTNKLLLIVRTYKQHE